MRSLEWVWRNNIRGNIINYGSVKRRDTYNGLHWSHTTRTHNSKRGGRSHHVELQNLISSDQGFFTSFFFLSYSLTNHLFTTTYRLIAFRKSLLFNVLLINHSFEFVYPFLFLYSLFQKLGCLSSIWQNFVWSTENFDCRTPLSFYRNSNCRNWFVKGSDKMKGNIWK